MVNEMSCDTIPEMNTLCGNSASIPVSINFIFHLHCYAKVHLTFSKFVWLITDGSWVFFPI